FALGAAGVDVASRLGHLHETGGGWLEWSAGSVLAVLLLWRFRHGAAREGWRELSRSLRALIPGGRTGGEAAG
ncbi:MAG: hypothetical protein OER88_07350, partial [Planctomycetota bacterium]|nr:hypothetical protein [Planctomycetota bacterium]